jgi:TolB-like protein/Flp pilus assembly protein TadD
MSLLSKIWESADVRKAGLRGYLGENKETGGEHNGRLLNCVLIGAKFLSPSGEVCSRLAQPVPGASIALAGNDRLPRKFGPRMKGISSSRNCLRFGIFEADLASRELRKNGIKIRLQGQPFQVLTLLLENRGQLVTREELRQRIWPADTFVDFDNSLNTAINKIREALGDSAEHPRYVETLPRFGYRFVGTIEAKPQRIESLAVLPLENLSRDPEQEYFAEGMTEALIATLAKIGALRVVSRTTAMHYKGVHRPLRDIARELQVDAIVEGTVLRSGDRVRISAQLIDARTDSHVWVESYDREMRDVLVLQAEVAQAIAREVRIKLTPLEKAQFSQMQVVIPEAYEAYLKGRYYWNRRDHDGFPKGVQYFEEAIAKDPGFAAAYAGLSDCLTGLSGFGFVAPAEVSGKAKQLAYRAVELDPGLAEARASVGWVKLWFDFDFQGAEKEFERAVELNPRYAMAHSWFGWYLSLMGRYEEAYTECQRALRLDPMSAPIQWVLAFVYWMARRFDQAIEQVNKILELDPSFVWGHGMVAWSYIGKSIPQSAIAPALKSVQLSPDSTLALTFLGAAYAAAGNREETERILDRLHELSKKQYVTPYGLARVHAVLGHKEVALEFLETAYLERAPLLSLVRTDSLLDSLRPEPRFQDLLRRMNFPE